MSSLDLDLYSTTDLLHGCFNQWYVNINRWGSVREWYGAFPDWVPLAEDSATKLKGCQLNVCPVYAYTVYVVLFSPLLLKSEPGWPAISVSTSQQFRVGQIVWFGWLSAMSQLAGRVGEGGGVWQLCLYSVTQPYTTWLRWREQGGGCVPSPWFLLVAKILCCYSEPNMRARHSSQPSFYLGQNLYRNLHLQAGPEHRLGMSVAANFREFRNDANFKVLDFQYIM